MPPDEARYGEIALALYEGRAPSLVPMSNGRVYPDKPPGYFWAINASALLLGEFHEGAVRLPSVAGGVLGVLGVVLIATPLAGPAAALLGALLLLATVAFSWQMRFAQMDMLVAGIVSLMMACLFRSWLHGERWWCLPAFLLLGAGAFIKGPVALIGLLAFIIWAVGTGRPRSVFNVPAAAGLVVLAAGFSVWVWRASIQLDALGPDVRQAYWQSMFGTHVMERLTGSVAHDKPWWAFGRMLPMAVLPATPLFLLLLQPSLRKRLQPGARTLAGFALVWAATYLVVLSVPAGKRDIYLLPHFPAWGLLGAVLATVLPFAARHFIDGWCGVVALAGAILGIGALLIASDPTRIEVWGASMPRIQRLFEDANGSLQISGVEADFLVYGATLVVLSLMGLFAMAKSRRSLALGLCALLCAVMIHGTAAWLIPHGNRLFSRRAVAEMVRGEWTRRQSEGPVYFFHHLDEGVPFYLRMPTPEVPSQAHLPEFKRLDPGLSPHRELAAGAVAKALEEHGALVIARSRDLERFHLREGVDYREVDRCTAGTDKQFVLLERLP